MTRIRLSEKYGVNPAIPVCFFCGKDKNEVILAGRLPNDAEAPRHAVWNFEPCDECQRLMQLGIIIVVVNDDAEDYRTAERVAFQVVKDSAVIRIFSEFINSPAMLQDALKKRALFLAESVWRKLGLDKAEPTYQSADEIPNE